MEVESFSKLEIMCKQWNNIEAHNILYTRSITGRPQNSETPKLGRRPVTAYRYCFSFYLMGFYGTLLVIRNGRIHQLRPFIIISLSLSFSFFSSLSFFFLFLKAGSGCFSRRVMETSMSACLPCLSVVVGAAVCWCSYAPTKEKEILRRRQSRSPRPCTVI